MKENTFDRKSYFWMKLTNIRDEKSTNFKQKCWASTKWRWLCKRRFSQPPVLLLIVCSAARAMNDFEENIIKVLRVEILCNRVQWKNQLWEEGSLNPTSKYGRPYDVNLKAAVVRYFTENNENVCQRKAAKGIGTSPATINRVLKNEDTPPWQYQMLHEILGDDFGRRLHFCESIVNHRKPDSYSKKMMFSDE